MPSRCEEQIFLDIPIAWPYYIHSVILSSGNVTTARYGIECGRFHGKERRNSHGGTIGSRRKKANPTTSDESNKEDNPPDPIPDYI